MVRVIHQSITMKSQPLFKAFGHAFDGMFHFFRTDRNGKIHLLVALLITVAGWFCKVSVTEWCIFLLCFGTVISFEMINHALEKLSDAVHPEQHNLIKVSKDVAAAAVLWATIISILIGILILLPKLISLL